MVWPALLPPWKRTTMSARFDSQSMILPLPSSPHWAPITVTLDMKDSRTLLEAQPVGEPQARWPLISGVGHGVRGDPPQVGFIRESRAAPIARRPSAGAIVAAGGDQ